MTKKKWSAFTLIELMVSLALFAIAMLAITNLMGTSLRLMNTLSGSDENNTQAIILSRIMESVVKDSYFASQPTNGSLIIVDFSQNKHVFKVYEKTIVYNLYRKDALLSSKIFHIENALEVKIKLLKNKGRQKVRLIIKTPQKSISDNMLLGYKKGDTY